MPLRERPKSQSGGWHAADDFELAHALGDCETKYIFTRACECMSAKRIIRRGQLAPEPAGAPLALLAGPLPPPRLPPEAAGPAPLTC